MVFDEQVLSTDSVRSPTTLSSVYADHDYVMKRDKAAGPMALPSLNSHDMGMEFDDLDFSLGDLDLTDDFLMDTTLQDFIEGSLDSSGALSDSHLAGSDPQSSQKVEEETQKAAFFRNLNLRKVPKRCSREQQLSKQTSNIHGMCNSNQTDETVSNGASIVAQAMSSSFIFPPQCVPTKQCTCPVTQDSFSGVYTNAPTSPTDVRVCASTYPISSDSKCDNCGLAASLSGIPNHEVFNKSGSNLDMNENIDILKWLEDSLVSEIDSSNVPFLFDMTSSKALENDSQDNSSKFLDGEMFMDFEQYSSDLTESSMTETPVVDINKPPTTPNADQDLDSSKDFHHSRREKVHWTLNDVGTDMLDVLLSGDDGGDSSWTDQFSPSSSPSPKLSSYPSHSSLLSNNSSFSSLSSDPFEFSSQKDQLELMSLFSDESFPQFLNVESPLTKFRCI